MAAAASSSTGVAPCVKVAVVGAARVGTVAHTHTHTTCKTCTHQFDILSAV